jgi:hypothetical protein
MFSPDLRLNAAIFLTADECRQFQLRSRPIQLRPLLGRFLNRSPFIALFRSEDL